MISNGSIKRRVLVLLHHLVLGGIEVQLSRALERFRVAGYQLDFCCTGSESELDSFVRAQGSEIYRIRRTANFYKTASLLRHLLVRHPYDIVHSQFGHTSGGICLGAAKCRVPCLVSIHSDCPTALATWDTKPGLRFLRQVWLTWHRRLMEKHCALFLGHSRTNLDTSFPGWSRMTGRHKRFRLIRNGIEFPQKIPDKQAARTKLNLSCDEVVVLHVGNFTTYKNQKGVLAVFEELNGRLPGCRLVLVGDGPNRAILENQIRQGSMSKSVRFEGQRRDVWDYYGAADLFIFPSLHEGFGNVLIEAQGVGLPVVASDIPAHREAVSPDQHRFLYEPHDYAKAVSLSLEQIGASRLGVATWVRAAKVFARENHSMSCFVQDSTAAYDHALRPSKEGD